MTLTVGTVIYDPTNIPRRSRSLRIPRGLVALRVRTFGHLCVNGRAHARAPSVLRECRLFHPVGAIHLISTLCALYSLMRLRQEMLQV